MGYEGTWEIVFRDSSKRKLDTFKGNSLDVKLYLRLKKQWEEKYGLTNDKRTTEDVNKEWEWLSLDNEFFK